MTPTEVKAAVERAQKAVDAWDRYQPLITPGEVIRQATEMRDAIPAVLLALSQATEENERLHTHYKDALNKWQADIERATKAEAERDEANRRVAELEALINSPETADFLRGVQIEAAHQVERWGADHDAGKEPHDWFWLIGYLGGKALAAVFAGDLDKAKHHTISTAAALKNWHAQLSGKPTAMRPGVDADERGFTALLSRSAQGGEHG